ncbi:TetR family transcriptional regulator [Bradyrhizobium sp. U87765 SZCCT0131]|uniref:TetR/AcrR family transcriptional regulator n=1 Tax=unclassified Bradyrhizobium TaxID=2631580 RepID=UPI001BABE7CB|nr:MULTISPECIES: TetR family transcriptional regulator [unclassified Bradyrhizobium]MBR1219199.1 TetR family transcriptional regulator [Bradyrhizobium sp. U87765 SZCCT0131]MBR1261850.1 TetR family transcriptional regulator [Bradyrhizobium sp. U87765 SZCCT0134]MBR1306297.1 TetR family transcriptional regulator [Bradyrhizobium sp. U87765 SZCCT0110]MBR1317632.1 TetR family transcriptional regulator [Bradyrhizobium sp. U87765 SZCCT0109]MBR1351334.1 TetR family transcriptional regulator [Bradyrhizo
MTASSAKPLRSQPTRDRILAAARRLFGEEGFERTTIRSVAAAAGIHFSMVMRYYGSKEGLFAAAATYDLAMPDLTQVPHAEIGRTLMRHFLQRWEADDGDLPALLRACLTHQDGRELMEEIFRAQVLPVIVPITGPALADERAALMCTQMLGLAMTRYVLVLPQVAALSHSTLIERVGATLQAYLTDGVEAGERAPPRKTAPTKPAARKRPARPTPRGRR